MQLSAKVNFTPDFIVTIAQGIFLVKEALV